MKLSQQLGILTLLVVIAPSWSKPAVRREVRSVNIAQAARFKRMIDGIIPPKVMKSLRVGICAATVVDGQSFYEHDADELVIPASTNKIFTAFTAMRKMKPTDTFSTRVYVTGSIKDGRLNGDLYLKGGGDPSLVSERMWMMVNEIIRSGIRTISGNLYADSSYFDQERTPETRPKYLKDQAYNAPIGALSFNFNTTTIFVRPGEIPGQPPIVYTDPENSYIDVVNQATTGKVDSNNTIVVSRTSFVKGDIGDTVLLRGSIPLDSREVHFYRNIVNPGLYTAHMFRTFWEQRGLKMDGNVLEGETPSKAKLILEFDSQPLWQIVWGMNKFSNNFVADQILKKVGAQVMGPPGTMAKGVQVMGDVLESIGIPRNSYSIHDGSGLTRDTKVTARQIVKVLLASHNDFSMAPEFISSLGVAGEDGTIRRRFGDSNLAGLLRAKTGTLDGVSALAGYAPSADGELIAFAIVLNDPKVRYGHMSGWADQIALALSKYSRKQLQ